MNTEQIEALKARRDFEFNFAAQNNLTTRRLLDDRRYESMETEWAYQAYLASATASAGRIAELSKALKAICDMQSENFGNGIDTHIDLIRLADAGRAALAGSATPSDSPAAADAGGLSEWLGKLEDEALTDTGPQVFTKVRTYLQAHGQMARPTAVMAGDLWHDAVLAECMKIEAAYDSKDPAKTLAALIDWHVQEASGVADGVRQMASNYMDLTCARPAAMGAGSLSLLQSVCTAAEDLLTAQVGYEIASTTQFDQQQRTAKALCDAKDRMQAVLAEAHRQPASGAAGLSPAEQKDSEVAVPEWAKKIAQGYKGGTAVSDFHGPKVTLRYATSADAELAFQLLTDAIDAAIAAKAKP